MREHAREGAEVIACLLERSVWSVRCAAYRHRISLRRADVRRGRVLGQCRGISLRRDIREDLASGRVDATALAARMQLDGDGALCPSCGMRPITVPSSGFCKVCHERRLAGAHREVTEEQQARRELWRARQQAKRTRDAAEAECQ